MAGFNVLPGDVVKVYVVDDLTNAADFNPTRQVLMCSPAKSKPYIVDDFWWTKNGAEGIFTVQKGVEIREYLAKVLK